MENQPEVHDPAKILSLNQPQPTDDYGSAARGARVLMGVVPGTAAQEGEGEGAIEVPPEGSMAVEETNKGPREATAEKVFVLCGRVIRTSLDRGIKNDRLLTRAHAPNRWPAPPGGSRARLGACWAR